MKDDSHYDVNRKLIEEYTGITDKGLQTEIMTNLFQFHYLGVANEKEDGVLFAGIKEFLDDLKEKHALSIATTLRKDIVENVVERIGLKDHFSYIAGNNARLSYTKEQLVKEVKNKLRSIDYIVGDKSDDVDAGLKVGAKGILVTWGSHKEYDKATVANTVKELYHVIK